MHDPSFLAWEIRAPIPLRDRWYSREARNGRRRPVVSRRTNAENRGERTYPWWALAGYSPRVGNTVFRFPVVVEVWHDEPGDRDMGTVCKDYSGRSRHRIAWTLKHRKHLRWKLIPYIQVRSWLFTRCEDCKRRFKWGEAKFGVSWSSPGCLHEHCQRLRTVAGQKADLVAYVRGEANDTQRWRVEYNYIHSGETVGRP